MVGMIRILKLENIRQMLPIKYKIMKSLENVKSTLSYPFFF